MKAESTSIPSRRAIPRNLPMQWPRVLTQEIMPLFSNAHIWKQGTVSKEHALTFMGWLTTINTDLSLESGWWWCLNKPHYEMGWKQRNLMTQDTSSREKEYTITCDTTNTCRWMREGLKFHICLSTNLIDKLLLYHLPLPNSILLLLLLQDIFIWYNLDRNICDQGVPAVTQQVKNPTWCPWGCRFKSWPRSVG